MSTGTDGKRTHGGLRNPPGGKPRTFSRPLAETILLVMRTGGYASTAADFAGIRRESMYGWLREGAPHLTRAERLYDERRNEIARVEAHNKTARKGRRLPVPVLPTSPDGKDAPYLMLPDGITRDLAWFAHTWRIASAEGIFRYIAKIEKASTRDGRLALEFIARRDPKRYGRRRLELTGADGKPIETEQRVRFFLPVNGREAGPVVDVAKRAVVVDDVEDDEYGEGEE